MKSRLRSAERADTFGGAIATLVIIAVVLIPLVVDVRGHDAFRLPKEIAFRGFALVLIAIAGASLAAGHRPPLARFRDPVIALATLVAAWSAVVVLTSTNHLLSILSAVTVWSAIVLFLAGRVAGSRTGLLAFDFALLPAAINAVLVLLQATAVWQPFDTPFAGSHLGNTALIGNPNDVASFLVTPAVAAVVAAVIMTGGRRWFYGAIALILASGLVATASRTALIAYAVSLSVFAVMRSRREVAAVILLVVVVIAAIATHPETQLGRSVPALLTAATERRYDLLFSERLPPFLAAIEMWRDHPVAGTGPGTFHWHYMRYRSELARSYPDEWTRGWPINFGETHNDHLQILAETGAPGLILFWAALLLVAIPRFRARKQDLVFETQRARNIRAGQLARAVALPLAIAIAITCLAQFPLQLAAPRMMMLFLAGLCTGVVRS